MTAICISLLYLSQKKIQISQSAHVSINLYIAFQFSYLLLTKYWIVFLLPYKNWQMSLGSALPLQMAIIDTRTVKVDRIVVKQKLMDNNSSVLVNMFRQ